MNFKISFVLGAVVLFLCNVATTLYAESQWGDFQTLLKELHEPAAVVFVSEEEKEKFKTEAEEVDVILTAKLDEVSIENINMGGSFAPMTKVELSEISYYRGEESLTSNYRYPGLPDSFVHFQNKRVIVYLAKNKAKDYEKIIKIQKASDWKLEILKEDYFQKDEDCEKPVVPVCDVEI